MPPALSMQRMAWVETLRRIGACRMVLKRLFFTMFGSQ